MTLPDESVWTFAFRQEMHNNKSGLPERDKMKNIIIDGVEYAPKINQKLSDYSIIRCRNAGVHFGRVVATAQDFVRVEGSRRLWKWWSDATLSELSQTGPRKDKVDEQRYGCVLPSLLLITADVCEIIACSELAAAELLDVPVWMAR